MSVLLFSSLGGKGPFGKWWRFVVSKCPVSSVPLAGTAVPKGELRRAGPYLLGPRLGSSPVRSIVQCLARKEHTGKLRCLLILSGYSRNMTSSNSVGLKLNCVLKHNATEYCNNSMYSFCLC